MAPAHAGRGARGARGAATQALLLTLVICLQAAAAVEEPALPPRWRYAGSHTEAQWLWLSDPMTLVVALVGILLFVLSQLKHRVMVGIPSMAIIDSPAPIAGCRSFYTYLFQHTRQLLYHYIP